MGRITFTRLVVAVALVLAVGFAGLGPASAARSAPRPAARRVVSPVGDYGLVMGSMDAASLTIDADGSFTMFDNADAPDTASGTWVSQGKTIALMLTTNGIDGVLNDCVFIGTITKVGLGSAAKPGLSSCGTEWHATRAAVNGVGTLPETRRRHRAAARLVNPVGTYRIFSSNGGAGKLKVLPENAIGSSYGDRGQWVVLNTMFAFGVATSLETDEGCIYLATMSPTGFASKTAPGVQFCPNFGALTWYAKRPKP